MKRLTNEETHFIYKDLYIPYRKVQLFRLIKEIFTCYIEDDNLKYEFVVTSIKIFINGDSIRIEPRTIDSTHYKEFYFKTKDDVLIWDKEINKLIENLTK